MNQTNRKNYNSQKGWEMAFQVEKIRKLFLLNMLDQIGIYNEK